MLQRLDEPYLLARGKEDKIARRLEQISLGRKQIESIRKSVIGSRVSLKVDMKADDAPKTGLRHLIVDVQDDGSVEIIGFNNDDSAAVENSKGRVLVKKIWYEEHPLVDLLMVIQQSNVIKSSAKQPAHITFENEVEKCRFGIACFDSGITPIAKITTAELPVFPHGVSFVLHHKDKKGILNLFKMTDKIELVVGKVNEVGGERKRDDLSAVWSSSDYMNAQIGGNIFQADCYVPETYAARITELKKKRPVCDIEISLNKKLQDVRLIQESIVAKKDSVDEQLKRTIDIKWDSEDKTKKLDLF